MKKISKKSGNFPNWMEVKKILPPPETDVLINAYDKDINFNICLIGYYNDRDKEWHPSYSYIGGMECDENIDELTAEVTHWMLLPKTPR